MNTYYFIFEVEPQVGNLVIAHVSRAVVHLWVWAAELDEARGIALGFLQSESWDVNEEKEGYLRTPEQIAGMEAEELSSFQAAQSEGIHSRFYYWHRAE